MTVPTSPTTGNAYNNNHMKHMNRILTIGLLMAAAADPAAAAEGAGAGAAPVETKPAREKQNGVTRPSAGTNTGKVWEIADSLSEKNGKPATRAEVVEAGSKAGLNPATVTTQFGQWRRFYGIKKELVEKPAKAPKEPKAPKAPKEPKAKGQSSPPGQPGEVVYDSATDPG